METVIWFRPRMADRADADAERPTVGLDGVEAVCDTEAEALEVMDRFVAHHTVAPAADPSPGGDDDVPGDIAC